MNFRLFIVCFIKRFARFDPKVFGWVNLVSDPVVLQNITNYFSDFYLSACIIPSLFYVSLFLIIRCFNKAAPGSVAAAQLNVDIRVTVVCCLNNVVLIINSAILGIANKHHSIWYLWFTVFVELLDASINSVLLMIFASTIRNRVFDIIRNSCNSASVAPAT